MAPGQYTVGRPEYMRQWRAKNPGKIKEYNDRRWANMTLMNRYTKLTVEAKKKSILVELDFEEYKQLATQQCYYCGGDLPKKGYGLDRVDNALGYIIGNCVPCCKECNRIKSDKYTYPQMRRIGRVLAELR